MSDSLHGRIAAVALDFYNYDPSWHPDDWKVKLADAVITELGLRRQDEDECRVCSSINSILGEHGSMIHTLRAGHAPWWSYVVLAVLVFVSMLWAGLLDDDDV